MTSRISGSVAQALTERMQATRRVRTKDSIFAIVSDDHNVHCLREEELDQWFLSLSPERKVVLFEMELEGLIEEIADGQSH